MASTEAEAEAQLFPQVHQKFLRAFGFLESCRLMHLVMFLSADKKKLSCNNVGQEKELALCQATFNRL